MVMDLFLMNFCCFLKLMLPAIAGCRWRGGAGGAAMDTAAAPAGCWSCIAGGAHNGGEDAPPALTTCRGCHLDLLHLVPVSRLEFNGERERVLQMMDAFDIGSRQAFT